MSFNAIAVFNQHPVKGTVSFHQCEKHYNTIVSFKLSGLNPKSKHGIHIHRYGILSVENACDSTCEHYNPTGSIHGSNKLHGTERHAGDLINNIETDNTGSYKYVYEDPMLNVSDIIGRSVVIHSGIDDMGRWRDDYSNMERQQGSSTTGTSGSRIACSVIGRAPEK